MTANQRRRSAGEVIATSPAGYALYRGWIDASGKTRTWSIYAPGKSWKVAEITTKGAALFLLHELGRSAQ